MNRREALSSVALLLGGTILGAEAFLSGCTNADRHIGDAGISFSPDDISFLDEIGEMSPQMQAKLLHVLQDGTFSRLGARNSTQVDVRVIAATNINMDAAIAQKRFREDLYYRLSAFSITIPPLRERREEIPILMEQLAARNAAGLCQHPIVFSERVLAAAQEYDWPGNL